MPASQPSQLEKMRRLDYIERRLSVFANPATLIAECAEEWDIAKRTVKGYVTEVKKRMTLRSRARTGVRRREMVRAQQAIAADAHHQGRFGDATRALQEVARLEGLHDRAPEDDDDE